MQTTDGSDINDLIHLRHYLQLSTSSLMAGLPTGFAAGRIGQGLLALMRWVRRRRFRRVARVLAQALAKFFHLCFQKINLGELLTQLGELTFIGSRANLKEQELVMERRESLLNRSGCLLPIIIRDAETVQHGQTA